jgi:hypothetical protein
VHPGNFRLLLPFAVGSKARAGAVTEGRTSADNEPESFHAMRPVSDGVRLLLDQRVDSIEKLSILVLLHGEPDRAWSPETVSERLNLPGRAVSDALDALCAASLLDVRVGSTLLFRYKPIDRELASTAEELIALYLREPVPVLKVLTANALDRARSSLGRAFADAFLLRKNQNEKKR